MNLAKSKLGTKEYWDQFYKREIDNFSQNETDTGENWFDDTGAEDRVCEYFEQLEPLEDETILDLGTGNGHMLFALKETGIKGRMLGIDYSEASVEFARKLAEHAGLDVAFEQADFINNPEWTSQQFDYINDKGTLDAIALSTIPNAVQKYRDSVVKLMKPTTTLVITSCNFTEKELS